MAKVIQNGTRTLRWRIQLMCPECDCVAEYDSSDVKLGVLSGGTVVCPECDQRFKIDYNACFGCSGTGRRDDGARCACKFKGQYPWPV